ncbi:MAG: ATP-binding cassette domain-containing protein [Bacillota bacterium]|nr:ATP-binding cassette domain-containing protein [Bacillota bacterium]
MTGEGTTQVEINQLKKAQARRSEQPDLASAPLAKATAEVPAGPLGPTGAISEKAGAALRATDLALARGGREIFRIPSFTLERGEVLALVGPNGAGKTSLLLTLALLLRPTRGHLEVDGTPVTPRNTLALRRRMAVVFQEPLLMDTTVLGNVLTGLRIRGVPRPAARRRAEEWLERLGIAHLRDRSALHLSGGEAQRVNLARAFALEPEILFLDEPFSALDYPTRMELLSELGRLLQETRITALFVTHDYTEIPHLARRVAVLFRGRIARVGTVEEILGQAAALPRIPAPWVGLE